MEQRKRSWLEGPAIPAAVDDGTPALWPGEKLGLPKDGPGSLASVMRRAWGVVIDWGICLILANAIHMFTSWFGGVATLIYLLYVLLGIFSVILFARTPGQAVLGMGVARVDQRDQRVGVVRAIVRTLCTALIFPAVMVDPDGRGIHDRATGTAVVRG